ncbi:hypothetical protein EYC84_009182 [Monilinia fructicola]|uniref:HRDC domain-containing protein n=1 Tax=Monilinia fructicola TaxID=38448 RepID=A0A5M9JE64_MONFR|nr:hypothetical protein EYC84_009182 [Monilinia fructicola]
MTRDFKSLQDEVQAALVGNALDQQNARLLALANELLKSAGSVSGLKVSTLEDVDDVDNNWRNVVDVVDSLLEKTDTCLDEYTGIIKRKQVEEPSATSKTPKKFLDNSLRTQNLVKPQLAFEVKPDNEDTSPWLPLLKTKPHAKVPLEDSLGMITNEFHQKQYKHPYETEILQLQYPKAITSATFVDTYEGVLDMLEELKSATEIAVDLEHHDTRSYVGLVSLMQISTREKDWIVDTLKPWRQQLQVLNEVFADPSIIKVFFTGLSWISYGFNEILVWLAGGSLAFLLKKYIDFDADKKYQLADWRIRRKSIGGSLTKSPKRLPYFDMSDKSIMRNLEKDLEDGFGLIYKTPALLNSEQFAVFKAVHAWRDQIARKDDDSINFVMSNSVVVNLAKFMPMGYDSFTRHNPTDISQSTSQKTSDFDVTPVDKTELTTETSSFWGGAFGSKEVFASSSTPLTNRSRLVNPEAQTPIATPTPSKLKEEAFVLKRGSKRKSDVMTDTAEDQEVAGKYDITLDCTPDAGTQRRQGPAAVKAAQKEEKRASKKQRKEEERQRKKDEEQNESDKVAEEVEDAESEEQEEEEEDFDYSKADSVLNSKKAKAEKGERVGDDTRRYEMERWKDGKMEFQVPGTDSGLEKMIIHMCVHSYLHVSALFVSFRIVSHRIASLRFISGHLTSSHLISSHIKQGPSYPCRNRSPKERKTRSTPAKIERPNAVERSEAHFAPCR